MVEQIGATTRYYGPTNHRGSRIRVTVLGDSKTFPYDYEASNAHVSAVKEMMHGLGYFVGSVNFVADSESGRGCVYTVAVVKEG